MLFVAAVAVVVVVVVLCSSTGFLEVRENWKKSRNLSGQGKVRGKIFFVKVRENENLVPSDVRFSG